jgi:histone H3
MASTQPPTTEQPAAEPEAAPATEGKKKSVGKQLAIRKTAPNTGGVKKPRRNHAGTVALREIHRYQKTGESLIQSKPFVRLVRVVTQDVKDKMGLSNKTNYDAESKTFLKEAVETYLVNKITRLNLLAIHRRRKTANLRDFEACQAFDALAKAK